MPAHARGVRGRGEGPAVPVALRRYVAEFLGTFVLVLVGTTALVGAERAQVSVLLVAGFAFGLALLAGLYAFAEVSGGHYNPAVSLALFLDRRLPQNELF